MKSILFLFVVFFFFVHSAFAGSEYYCTYFGGVMKRAGQESPAYGPALMASHASPVMH